MGAIDGLEFETAQRRLFDAVGLDPRSRFVDLTDPRARIHVFERGRSGAYPPLLFVHGTGTFGAFMAPLMAQFDDARTVAFDRPGYGLSDPFRYSARTFVGVLVDGMAALVDALGVDRVDIVGHSMGGHAAIRFAIDRPERVRRLVTVGAVPGFPGTSVPLPYRLLTVPLANRLLIRLQRSGEEGVLDLAEVFGERDAIVDHPKLVRAIAAHEADPAATEATVSEIGAFGTIRGWRSSFRLGPAQLGELRRPTLLIWGRHDPLGGPADVRAGVDSIPDARFEAVDAGHMPFLAHAAWCADRIREHRRADPTGDG